MKCQEKCLQMPLLFRMFVFICGFVYIIFSWSVQLRNVFLSSAHEHEQQFRRFFSLKNMKEEKILSRVVLIGRPSSVNIIRDPCVYLQFRC